MKTAILTVIAILVVLIIITFLLCGLIFSNLICTKPISVPDFIVRLLEKFLAGSGVPDSYPEDAARAEERLKELPFEDITLKAPDAAKLRGHVLRPRFPNGCVVIACHGARSNALGEFCFMIPELYKQGIRLSCRSTEAAVSATENSWDTALTNPRIRFSGLIIRKKDFRIMTCFCWVCPWGQLRCL